MTLTHQDTASAPDATNLAIGSVLFHGLYEITGFVNSGGWGKAYLARNSLHQQILLKECYPEAFCRRDDRTVVVTDEKYQPILKAAVSNFVHEARQLATVQHPNVVDVHQVFEENSTAYIAMEFIEGEELLIRAEQKPSLGASEVVHILRRLLLAMNDFHGDQMLHRDIAPDNIILRADSGEPVLIDFGAAKRHQAGDTAATNSMITVKSGYSPPEFYDRNAAQTPASDLYSLAATLYFVIAERLPVDAETRKSAVEQGQIDPNPALLDTAFDDYPAIVLQSIEKAMSLAPGDRFQSAQEWLSFIENETKVIQLPPQNPQAVVLDKASAPEPETAPVPQKSKFPALAAGFSLIALLAGGGAYLAMSNGTVEPSEAAMAEAPTPSTEAEDQTSEQATAQALMAPAAATFAVSDTAPKSAQPANGVWTEQPSSGSTLAVHLTAPSAQSPELAAFTQAAQMPQDSPSVPSATEELAAAPTLSEITPELGDKLTAQIALPSVPHLPNVPTLRPAAQVSVATDGPGLLNPEEAVANVGPQIANERTLPAGAQIKSVQWRAKSPYRLSPRIDQEGRRVLTVRRSSAGDSGLAVGTDILAVQGQPLEQVAQFSEAMTFDAAHHARLRLMVREPGARSTSTKFVSFYEQGHVVLASGISLQISRSDDSWLHVVTGVPSGETAFEVGDVLTDFTQLDALEGAIASAVQSGQSSLELTVDRSGTLKNIPLSLAKVTREE